MASLAARAPARRDARVVSGMALRALALACAGAAAEHTAQAQEATQSEPAVAAAQVAPVPDTFVRPGLRTFRHEEDYSFLADPIRRERWIDGIKYVGLSDTDRETFLSIGGELRLRYESYWHPNLGLAQVDRNDYLLTRAELHADLHWTRHARFFVEGISGGSSGEELAASPSQENELDLQQAFAEAFFEASGEWRGSLRAGRMEMGYGSYRLVSPRDGTNLHIDYDGVRVHLEQEAGSIDAFVTRPVEQKVGAFDDTADEQRLFFGLYGVIPLQPREALGLDLYYLGLRREDAQYGSVTGTEDRHSAGARLWGRSEAWDLDTEAVGQFGDFDGQDIRAWTLASSTGYRFGRESTAPRLGCKVNIASGDRDPDDSTLGTFNALFPRNNYFSEAVLFAPANFYDLQPNLQVSLTDALRASFSADAFFRLSTEDAVYAPGQVAIPADASDRRYVGTTGSAQLEWKLSEYTAIQTAYVHFWAGDVVDDAQGSDVDFVMVSLSFRF